MTTNRFFSAGLVVFLGGVGLALTQFRFEEQPRNLDTYSQARLLRDLNDELDDIEEDLDPGASIDIDELQTAIMSALSDEGDDDDAEESDLDLADLEAEMQEDGADLKDVVSEALAYADQISHRERSPQLIFRYAGFSPAAQSRQNHVAQVRTARTVTAQRISARVYHTRK